MYVIFAARDSPQPLILVDVRETFLVVNLCVIVVFQQRGGEAVTFCTLFSIRPKSDHCLPLSQTDCLTHCSMLVDGPTTRAGF